MNKLFKVGDIQKWRGTFNNDANCVDGGYLYFYTKIEKNKDGEITASESKGIRIDSVKNRSEAIKKYKANPDNPNNYNYIV